MLHLQTLGANHHLLPWQCMPKNPRCHLTIILLIYNEVYKVAPKWSANKRNDVTIGQHVQQVLGFKAVGMLSIGGMTHKIVVFKSYQ